jgi:ABC-type multidrug transport system fused ATPase/permease subunit
MEKHIEELASKREHDGHSAMRNVFRAIFKKWTTLNMVAFLWMCIFLTVCLTGVYQQWLTIGAFATVFYLAYDLWKTLESMVYIQDEFIEHRNGFLRLTETLKQPWQSLDHDPLSPLNKNWKEIDFKDVSFAYKDEKHPALENIDLAIQKGEKVALVGPSGAGKSTFIKLFMKQTEPSQGSITIDGTPLKNIKSSEWIGEIGFVPQDVELFNMSIKENILLDKMNTVPEDEYTDAIRQAALGEFINNLPEKDSTIVGERGIKLSGGQKQRLGIARALVRKTDIIVFDEATSALDSLSEKAIQDAIDLTFSGKTLIVIAHRLSTVQHVDKIIVFDKGKVVETGNFRDLIKKQNIFAKMWALQSDNYLKEAS